MLFRAVAARKTRFLALEVNLFPVNLKEEKSKGDADFDISVSSASLFL